MKRWLSASGVLFIVAIFAATLSVFSQRGGGGGQRGDGAPAAGVGQPGPNQDVPIVNDVPLIPFESVPNFFKINPDMNFGETLGVAVNSKGNIVVVNHPGTATAWERARLPTGAPRLAPSAGRLRRRERKAAK